MNTYWKFGAIVAVVIGVLVWLAMGGVTESKTYYKEIKEVTKMGPQAQGERLRVNGYVEQGSIVRDGASVSFVLHQTPGSSRRTPCGWRWCTPGSIRCPTRSRITRRLSPTES